MACRRRVQDIRPYSHPRLLTSHSIALATMRDYAILRIHAVFFQTYLAIPRHTLVYAIRTPIVSKLAVETYTERRHEGNVRGRSTETSSVNLPVYQIRGALYMSAMSQTSEFLPTLSFDSRHPRRVICMTVSAERGSQRNGKSEFDVLWMARESISSVGIKCS